MPAGTRRRPRIDLPDIQRDSIAEVSQKLTVIAARLRGSEIDSNLDEVNFLISEVKGKVNKLNQAVDNLIKSIRRKQETTRRSERPDERGNREDRNPDTALHPSGGESSGDKQRQQTTPPEQRSLRKRPQRDGSSRVESAGQRNSMRGTISDCQGGPRNASEVPNPVPETGQDSSRHIQASHSEKRVSSITRGMAGKLGDTGTNKGEDPGCGSALPNDGEARQDAFSRELVGIFNQCIGEDPGGPSGFLGAIDAPGVPDCDAEDDEVRGSGPTDGDVSITIESDSDREETLVEISQEGPPQDPEQTIEGATIAYNFSDDTLDRLLPGVQLKDTTILDLLSTILPATAEPLIARWAITNFPASGLAGDFTASSGPPPMLRHKVTSTCLFLVYNVIFGTLNCDLQGNGNHWILVVVDLAGFRIHVFGTEYGLEFQAHVLATNVGTFVNGYRLDQGEDAIQWSEPRYNPLYPCGIVPDEYNCGICVLNRAETFIYPERTLQVSANTTPAALSAQLDRLRNQYRSALLDRYGTFCADRALQARIVSSVPHGGSFLTKSSRREAEPQPVRVSRFSLRIRPTSPDTGPRLVASEQWKTCLFRCAESNGLPGQSIVRAFEGAPASDLSGVLRALQCMCEVANANLLLRLKKILASENRASLREPWPSEPRTLVEIVELHRAIDWFDEVDPYLSIFKASCCQINYHASFQRRVESLSGSLREERKRRKRLRRKNMRNSRSDTLQRSHDNSSARQRVLGEVIELVDPEKVDRANVEDAVRRYEKDGRILGLLKGCRSSFWLLLYPLYDNQPASFDFVRQPILNVLDFDPPETFNRLRKPISRADLVGMTGQIAEYFGSSLFVARPELEDIILNREDGQFDCGVSIYFKSDEEISTTKPRDVQKLFMSSETRS